MVAVCVWSYIRMRKLRKSILVEIPQVCLIILSFSVLLNVAVVVVAHDGGGEECVIVFENEDMRMRARDECNKTNPFDEAKLVEHYPINATLEEFEFDDNCFTNCVYKAEKIISEDGKLMKDEVQHFFKSNMSTTLFTKLTSLFYACIDTSEAIASKKNMNPCAKASLHEYCVVKGIITSHDLLQIDC